MNKTVDIIIPTLRRIHAFKCLRELYSVPWPYKLNLVTDGFSWSQAVNIGLNRVQDNDVILMDDDVIINSSTFKTIDDYYDEADMFGFKLYFPTGPIQHAGAYYKDGHIFHFGHTELDKPDYDVPRYVCHVTTSLCYIKNSTLKKVGLMDENIPGVQFEDVDFCFRVLKAGLKILYLPSPAVHMESATKRDSIMGFSNKMSEAYSFVKMKHLNDEKFIKELESYPKQFHARNNEILVPV